MNYTENDKELEEITRLVDEISKKPKFREWIKRNNEMVRKINDVIIKGESYE
jgi:uncharacterized ferredoxin-like protein